MKAHERPGETLLKYKGKKVRFVLLEVRHDWEQYSAGMGFAYSNQTYPCWYCPVLKHCMHKRELPAAYTHQDYMQQVKRCQLEVAVDKNDLCKLFEHLAVDLRKNNCVQGVALKKRVSVFCLNRKARVDLHLHDRLDIGGCCEDTHCKVADIVSANPKGPYRLWFWRTQDRGLTFLSQIFKFPGFRFEMCMIDDLHTVDLGITSRLSGYVFMAALKSGMFRNEAAYENQYENQTKEKQHDQRGNA